MPLGGHGPAYVAEPADDVAWVPPAGTPPSPDDEVAGGTSSTTQCVNVPDGASGSSTTRANAAASSGTSVQASGGDTSSPSQVYRCGIGPPSANAELVTVIVSGASTSAGDEGPSFPHPASRGT